MVCSWPFSDDPKGSDRTYFEDQERDTFYEHISQKRYSEALQIVKTKATQNSLDEMTDLMTAFEVDIMNYSNETKKAQD